MKKSNGIKSIIENNKKELIVLAIFVFLALLAVIIDKSFALDEGTSVGDINNNFYINYDNTSDVKIGTNVRIGDTIKYQAVYTNYSEDTTNSLVSINLSKGLEYVEGSSSIPNPEIKNNDDGSVSLNYERSIVKDASETLTFSCIVNESASLNVSAFMTMNLNESVTETPKLVNNLSNFIVNYETDGNGVIKGSASENVDYNMSPKGVIVVPNDGYTFKGWMINSSASNVNGKTIDAGSIITDNELKSIKVDKDLTFVANFESKSKKYKITYKDGDSSILQPVYVEKGEQYTLEKVPQKEGYTALGWNIGGKDYSVGARITVKKDTTINAVYYKDSSVIKKYNVVYKINSKSVKSLTANYGEEITLPSIKYSNSCVCNNWIINGEKYKSGDVIAIGDNITIIGDSSCINNSTSSNKDKSNVNPSSKKSVKVSKDRY